MTKRYNSVISLLASIDHHTEDGSDITANQIRERLHQRLADVDDAELLEAVGLEDTYEDDTIEGMLEHMTWICDPDNHDMDREQVKEYLHEWAFKLADATREEDTNG